MKKLTCEICGSTDFVKQDGMFVCQGCGTKYSVEEAKKMMTEGDADVSVSTIKADNAGELANLYQLARRARETSNNEDAAKYYEMILLKDPNSWEATFYKTFYKAASCRIIEIASAANSIKNVIPTVFSLIEKYEDEDKKESAVCEVIEGTKNICWALYLGAMSHYDKFFSSSDSTSEMNSRLMACVGTLSSLKMALLTLFFNEKLKESERIRDACISAYETIQRIYVDNYDYHFKKAPGLATSNMWEPYQNVIDTVEKDFIKPLDENHSAPVLQKKQAASVSTPSQAGGASPSGGSAQSGGCYVATAVYGSYDCPEVWTLRRYRDYELAETWYGRAFIRTYYAVSPTLVKWFGDRTWFKAMWKGRLDHMVQELNEKGFESTPYQDRNWN